MKPLSEILHTIGATQRDVENWMTRLDLQLNFEPTVRGRARLFSRANAMELALIAAFVRAGFPPSKALASTRTVLHAALAGLNREWIVIPAGDASRGFSPASFDLRKIADSCGPASPPVYAVIWLDEVVRRVDALFSGQTEA